MFPGIIFLILPVGCKVAQVAAVSTTLRTTINNYFREFNTFLENINDICNHHGNIQTDLIEVFKMNNKLFFMKSGNQYL